MANPFDKFSKKDDANPFAKFSKSKEEEVSTVEDVAKSAGIGAVKGVLSLPALPGNLEALGRAGIDWGAKKLGYEDPRLSENQALPTSADLQEKVESVTGKFYEPKTRAGRYAETVGEFIPGVLGPGSMASKVVGQVVVPGVTSEYAAEQAAGTGYEDLARVAAAALSPAATAGAMRVVTPAPATNLEHLRNVRTLRENGVPLTAGDVSGSEVLRATESHLGQYPLAGGRFRRIKNQQGEAYTRAAGEAAGMDTPRLNDVAMDENLVRMGQGFDDLASQAFAYGDQALDVDLNTIQYNYFQNTPHHSRMPRVENTISDIRNELFTGRPFTGERYAAYRTRIDEAARNAANPTDQAALFDIRNALDDLMERNLHPQDAEAWRTLRRQYRNFIPLERAMSGPGSSTAEGLVSPSQLRSAVVGQNRRDYVRGRGDLSELARAGEAVLRPVANSGTPARLAGQGITSAVGAAVGMAAGGPVGAAAGTAAGALAPSAAGRLLMSRPVQGYLRNQVATPAMLSHDPYKEMLINLLNSTDEANSALRGGSGPRYENGKLKEKK